MSHFLELSPPIFNKLFSNISDPISILENGVFVECNSATLSMLRYEFKKDFIGKTPWEISPEFQSDGTRSFEKARMFIKKSFAEGSVKFEWEHIRNDGTIFTAEIVLTSIPDMERETVFVIWRDVSDTVKTRVKIKEIENKFRHVTENAPSAILIYQNFRWIYANKSVEEIFGISQEIIVGEDIFKYVHPSQKKHIIENAAKRVAGEKVPDRYDMCVITPAGEEKWLDTKISNIMLEGKESVLVNALDITKKVEAEKRLRESRERYKITLSSIGDAVIATDSNGKIQIMNPIAEILTGWCLSEAKGEPLEKVFNIFNAFSGQKVENPVTKVLKEGKIVGLANHTILKSKTGQVFQIADSGAPIKDEFGNIQGVVLVFRDVTEKYLIDEKMKQAQKMEAVGHLASGIAHDFNNIISGILGSAEILSDIVKGNKETEEFVQRIKEASLNACDLTKELINFSNPKKKETIKTNINYLISSTIEMIKSSIDTKINILYNDFTTDPFVKCDVSQIKNVIINLIFNARDSMPDGGVISLSTSEYSTDDNLLKDVVLTNGNYMKISVSDAGLGIDEKIIHKIFDPYFTTKPAGKGTGLGLSMVYKTVTAHNGAVTVKSEIGKGSVFEVYLPK